MLLAFGMKLRYADGRKPARMESNGPIEAIVDYANNEINKTEVIAVSVFNPEGKCVYYTKKDENGQIVTEDNRE